MYPRRPKALNRWLAIAVCRPMVSDRNEIDWQALVNAAQLVVDMRNATAKLIQGKAMKKTFGMPYPRNVACQLKVAFSALPITLPWEASV